MIYYATFAGLLLSVYLSVSNRDARVFFYWTFIVWLFLFVGFRYEVGCDWGNYLRHYLSDVDSRDLQQIVEFRQPGYWIVIWFLKQLDLPYQALNIVTSGIFFIGLHVLARRQPNPLVFILFCFPILILNMPMAATRQAMAIGFMCLAYSAFIDKRLARYVGIILLGSTFHSSILLFLGFAPFVWGKFGKVNILVSIFLSLPAFYFISQTGAAELASERYIDTEIDAAGAVFRLAFLVLTGLLFIFILAPSWRQQFPQDYKMAALGSWLMVTFFSLLFLSSVIGDRLGYYLVPIQAMIFARVPFLRLGRYRQIYSILPYLGSILIFLAWSQLSSHFNRCYMPYQFKIY